MNEPEGQGSAMLIRALEPVPNLPANTRGPGLLCKAMGIDRRHDGHALLSDDFYIAAPMPQLQRRIAVVRRPRIGVAYAGEWAGRLLRFYIEDHPFVSRK
jgi:DNA-3-methyladenine glycosylase